MIINSSVVLSVVAIIFSLTSIAVLLIMERMKKEESPLGEKEE